MEEEQKKRRKVAPIAMITDDGEAERYGLWAVFSVVALVVLSTVAGIGIWSIKQGDNATAGVESNQAVVAQGTATDFIADDESKIIVEDGVVKFYFATGTSELAEHADIFLEDVVNGVIQDNKKAIISGFADSTGDAQLNEELSKKRAFAVRDALLELGVPESYIEMRKPENITGTGSNAEARRVEVVLE